MSDRPAGRVLAPGVDRALVEVQLAARGFVPAGVAERGPSRFFELRFTDAEGGQASYTEDHVLGQRVLLLDGVAALALADGLPSLAAIDPAAALLAAEAATDPVERVALLGPPTAHVSYVGGDPELEERLVGLLLARVRDGHLAVRRATLVAAAYLASPSVLELLGLAVTDPDLAGEAGRQLAVRERARREAELAGDASASVFELGHEAAAARAQAAATAGLPLLALCEGRIALALARRAGVRLGPLVALCERMTAAYTAGPGGQGGPSGAGMEALASLQELVAGGQFHAAEEVLLALLALPLPGRVEVNLLDMLAEAVSGRGRPDLAVEPLRRAVERSTALLALEPEAAEVWLARARLLSVLAALEADLGRP